MEKQRAATKFKAAARIARVTHNLVNVVRKNNAFVDGNEITDEEAE